MTLEERSRAKKLSMLSKAYVKLLIPHKAFVIVMLILMVLVYSIWFFADVSGYIPATHIFLSNFILFLCSNDLVGDNDMPTNSDIGILPVTGAAGTGAFLCTLPFKAKDILCMRLRTLEINFAVVTGSAVIMQIVLILTNSSEGLFPSGFCAAVLAFSELLYMVVTFIRKYPIKLYANLTVFVFAAFASCVTFIIDEDTYPMIKAFEFLSGWAGLAVIIISPILISAAGEIYLKNKKDPSWHLK